MSRKARTSSGRASSERLWRVSVEAGNSQKIAASDRLIARFGGSSLPWLRVQVAQALARKGIALEGLGRSEEAVAVFQELIERFGVSAEPDMQVEVAQALDWKRFILIKLGRNDEALLVCEAMVAQYGEALEPELRGQVVSALERKAYALSALKRPQEQLAVCEQLIARLGQATEARDSPELGSCARLEKFGAGKSCRRRRVGCCVSRHHQPLRHRH